ncbi:hypothetical protein [Nigerium massiliense]|uniref:hypothetical protein n=1 Tax=Nigerium massiliense TaxID=1522317 RepID=UPI00058FAE42|nr:hypothetical protein [Nigerium massiliense]
MTADLSTAWWNHLQGVRWFGGKGSPGRITELAPLPFSTAPGVWPAVRSEIATLSYDDGRTEHYHLLAAYRPAADVAKPLATVEVPGLGQVAATDATEDPQAVLAFVTAVAENPGGHMTWNRALTADDLAAARVWRGEQSNTTIVLGGSALFKLFRKVEPGPNLDAEVLTALDGTPAATPALFGRLTGAWPVGQVTDLGMVIEKVADVTDGWELATAACAAGEDFADRAAELGRSLRRVHDELRTRFPTATVPGSDVAATMTRRLDEAIRAADVLAPHRDALAAGFAGLAGTDVAVQRVHGDFHLGQTLAGADGRWTIIDFEGEPAKSAAERREPDSPWRDVAGMLRSFDYVRSAHPRPESEAATSWSRTSREAFLTGYCGGLNRPAALLDAYEIDKAIYEVVYETRNRPDWVSIPMRAVMEQARRASIQSEDKE